jgi:tetratricopeptide (TPR) repeat protein
VDADRAGVSRGRALLAAHRPADALKEFGAILAREPEDFECLCLAASAEIDLKLGDDAVDHAQTAARLQPESELACRLIAYALMVNQRLGPARDAAQRAIELDPNSWLTHLTRAQVDVAGKRLSPQSVYSAELAVMLAPNEPATHLVWGQVLRMDRDAAGAEAQFREVLKLEPNNRDALFELGISKLRKGDHEEASGVFVDFLATDARSQAAVFNLRVAAGRNLRWLTWLLLIFTGVGWVLSVAIALSHDPAAADRVHLPLIVLSAIELAAIAASILGLRRAVGSRFGRFVTGVLRIDRLLALWAVLLVAVLALCIVGLLVPVATAAWVYFAAVLVILGAKYTESERARRMRVERLSLS